jgi:hypothetical protein
MGDKSYEDGFGYAVLIAISFIVIGGMFMFGPQILLYTGLIMLLILFILG